MGNRSPSRPRSPDKDVEFVARRGISRPHPLKSETTTKLDVEQLYREHFLPMVKLITLRIGDRQMAYDVVQDVFARWYSKPPRITHEDAVLPYLRRSVLNAATNELRTTLRRRNHETSWYSFTTKKQEAVDVGLILTFELRALHQAIRALPRRQQEVMVLRYFSELSILSISQTLDIRPNAVKASLFKARQALLTNPILFGGNHNEPS